MSLNYELWDLHVHYKPDSQDATHTLIQILKNCNDKLSGLVITNHNVVSNIPRIYADKFNISLIPGVEITADIGHFIIIGLDKAENSFSNQITFEELIDEVNDHYAILFVAHPFAKSPFGLSEEKISNQQLKKISAIEINGKWGDKIKSKDLALKWGLPTVGGSDAHQIRQLNTMATLFQREIVDMDTLIQEIKSKRCKAVSF